MTGVIWHVLCGSRTRCQLRGLKRPSHLPRGTLRPAQLLMAAAPPNVTISVLPSSGDKVTVPFLVFLNLKTLWHTRKLKTPAPWRAKGRWLGCSCASAPRCTPPESFTWKLTDGRRARRPRRGLTRLTKRAHIF